MIVNELYHEKPASGITHVITGGLVTDSNKLVAIPREAYSSELEEFGYEKVGRISIEGALTRTSIPYGCGLLTGWKGFAGVHFFPYEAKKISQGLLYHIKFVFDKPSLNQIKSVLTETERYFGHPYLKPTLHSLFLVPPESAKRFKTNCVELSDDAYHNIIVDRVPTTGLSGAYHVQRIGSIERLLDGFWDSPQYHHRRDQLTCYQTSPDHYGQPHVEFMDQSWIEYELKELHGINRKLLPGDLKSAGRGRVS